MVAGAKDKIMENENWLENKGENEQKTDVKEAQKQIAGAIIIAGIIIAGAILLKGNKSPEQEKTGLDTTGVPVTSLAPVGKEDRALGNSEAKVTVIMYEDFQCPFCAAISGLVSNTNAIKYLKQNDPSWTPFMPVINDYIKNGSVQFVYRDYAFLGPESIRSAEAARCAGDQGKFWEYHDYLYGHQNGENGGNFSDRNLKSFAKVLGLDATNFNKCLDSSKYEQAVTLSKTEGSTAGVSGTPKGFILRNGKVVSTIDGAEPLSMVKAKIDNALR